MKIKTRSSAKSRVRFTGTGKAKIMKASRKHLLKQKSSKQKGLGKTGKCIIISTTHKKVLKRVLPNS